MALEPLIKMRDLDIIYNLGKSNEYKASQKVTFDIYPGEYIIFFGPSGCGKSTLMYCILGALPNTAGEILVKGESPYLYNTKRLVEYQRSTVGIIYQAFYLIPSITVADNVVLPLIFASMDLKSRRARSLSLLRRFGVEHQADKLPLNLSGGQQQRVAVARSLVGDPEILLADEPVGNLDSKSADQVMDMLSDINSKEKKTVILVTHDAKYLPYAHRIFYLRDGKLERIVVNPEKEQIMKTGKKGMVTEIEKLARIYPYLSPEELKIKSIVNYLTQDLGFDQLERLERAIQLLQDGKVDTEQYFTMLVTSFGGGGVGLDGDRARMIAKKTEKIFEESQDITRFRRRVVEAEESLSEHGQLVARLRAYLLDQYEGEITMARLHNLEDAISQRLLGEYRKDDFEKRLFRSVKDGGVGFRLQDAINLSVYFEKLIAQGIQIAGGGH